MESGASRPDFIKNVAELPNDGGAGYPGSDEVMSERVALSRPLGLTRLGIHHEMLPPGCRTSWPHAESDEEEFVYVLEGHPDVWINGHLHRLRPGDSVAFVPGTGIAHTVINNSDTDARILVIGEKLPQNRCFYPLKPEAWPGMPEHRIWRDAPPQSLGPHDGMPLKASR